MFFPWEDSLVHLKLWKLSFVSSLTCTVSADVCHANLACRLKCQMTWRAHKHPSFGTSKINEEREIAGLQSQYLFPQVTRKILPNNIHNHRKSFRNGNYEFLESPSKQMSHSVRRSVILQSPNETWSCVSSNERPVLTYTHSSTWPCYRQEEVRHSCTGSESGESMPSVNIRWTNLLLNVPSHFRVSTQFGPVSTIL